MIDNINNSGIDVAKVRQLFSEIEDFMLKNEGTQEYAMARVQIADEVFNLTREIMELMYLTNLQFLRECDKFEAMNKIKLYSEFEDNLHLLTKDLDILQA